MVNGKFSHNHSILFFKVKIYYFPVKIVIEK